jgi:hypothetical protein
MEVIVWIVLAVMLYAVFEDDIKNFIKKYFGNDPNKDKI